MTANERELKRQIMRGKPQAFPQIYAAYGDRIYRFCFRLCGNVSDAEDLTQEVFVAAFQGLERFEGRASLATWLYRIAIYKWRRLGSKRSHDTKLNEEMQAGGFGFDPSSSVLDGIALDQALAELPNDLYEVFALVKSEGLTYREAADTLGIPQGTVQWRVHEAIARLRKRLASEPFPESVEQGNERTSEKREEWNARKEAASHVL